MAKLLVLPHEGIISGLKKSLDFYYWMGIPVARRWPRSPGPRRASAVEAQWPAFTIASQLWTKLDPNVQDAYRQLAEGSGVTGRDMAIKGYLSGIYRYEKEVPLLASCHAYLNTQMDNLTSGAWYILSLDAELYDYQNNFNPTTHKFVAPRDGRYKLTVNVAFINTIAVGVRWLMIRKNAAEGASKQDDNNASIWQFSSLSCDLDCSKGDEIDVLVFHSCGINTVDIGAGYGRTNMFVTAIEH